MSGYLVNYGSRNIWGGIVWERKRVSLVFGIVVFEVFVGYLSRDFKGGVGYNVIRIRIEISMEIKIRDYGFIEEICGLLMKIVVI